ncbi:MAG TPA: DUF4339 domain-containing protein [Verrucomicrobiae bacterium]|nr:DUF4339 domain-containing protein [Verrucomicrobiae bacterium]
MNFNLYREGRPVEATTLELLRQRRASGELDETALLWREGMADWEPIDVVLSKEGATAPRVIPPPIPRAAGASKRSKVIGTIVAVVLVIGFVEVVWVSRNVMDFVRDVRNGGGSDADAVRLAQQPIPVSTNALTQSDVQREARAFRYRQYVQGYEERGARVPEIDSKVREFLNEWLAVQYGDRENDHALRRLLHELRGDPRCTDPLVLAIMALNTVDRTEHRELLQRAVTGFEKSRHRAYPKFYATITLARLLGAGSQVYVPLENGAIRHYQEALADGSFVPGDQPAIADMLIEGNATTLFRRHSGTIVEITRAAASKFPWLAHVLEGEHETRAAWRARGGGYASSVTAEGWAAFGEHLSRARAQFTEAWKLKPDWALAPGRMVYVTMGDSGIEEMRTWFDRAVAGQVDHPDAWSNMRWGLRPRWHGSLEALQELGVTAINSGRFDSDAPRMFLDCVHDIEAELEVPRGEHIYGRDDIWPSLEQMYNGYIGHHANTKELRGWRSAYTVVASLAGRYDVARTQLTELNWELKPATLSGWSRDLTLLPGEIALRTSALAEEADRAEALRRAGSVEAALHAYEKLLAGEIADERARRFVQLRIESLKVEQQLATGNWVSFAPSSAADPLWNVVHGEVRPLNEGSFEARSGADGYLLYSRARVGPVFTMRFDFEVVSSATGDFQAGLVLGIPDPGSAQSWYSCRVRKRGSNAAVYLSPAFTKTQTRRRVVLNEGKNSLELRFDNGRAVGAINGTEIFRRASSPSFSSILPEESMLGFGAYNEGAEETIRFTNVQVRRHAEVTEGTAGETAVEEQGE